MPKTTAAPWSVVDRPELAARCPHCEEVLDEVYTKGTGVPLTRGGTLVYFCPHCRKIMGFAQGRAT